ncbi:MAG: hypothetical protein V4437_00560 [Patescibacteria group bacterium]
MGENFGNLKGVNNRGEGWIERFIKFGTPPKPDESRGYILWTDVGADHSVSRRVSPQTSDFLGFKV